MIGQRIASSPDALGAVVAHVHPDAVPLGIQVAEALPRLLNQPFDRYSLHPGLTRHLAAGLHQSMTRPQIVAALAAVPDAAQRQNLITELGGLTRSTGSLSLARELSGAMPDAQSARTFIEQSVIQRFHR